MKPFQDATTLFSFSLKIPLHQIPLSSFISFGSQIHSFVHLVPICIFCLRFSNQPISRAYFPSPRPVGPLSSPAPPSAPRCWRAPRSPAAPPCALPRVPSGAPAASGGKTPAPVVAAWLLESRTESCGCARCAPRAGLPGRRCFSPRWW